MLQHGSIRFEPDPEWASRAVASARGGATSLRELGVAQSLDEVRQACAEALRLALGGVFEAGGLTDREQRCALESARRREKEGWVEARTPPRGSQGHPWATDR